MQQDIYANNLTYALCHCQDIKFSDFHLMTLIYQWNFNNAKGMEQEQEST